MVRDGSRTAGLERRSVTVVMRSRLLSEECPGALEVGRSVDAERHGVNERDVDAHPCFQRTQLLQPLAPFEQPLRKLDEAVKCGPAIGIEPDMMIVVALAPRH